MELVKQIAIASLKIFRNTDDCMSVLVPIAHNAHHHNGPYICSGIFFFNDECIANMHHMILIGRLLLQLLSAVLYEFSSTTIMTSNSYSGNDRFSGSGYVFGNDN
jgi:hypothetical protein